MRLTPDKHLHSREHLLADDLSRMMLESKRFAAYLGIAQMYPEADLRALAKYVLIKRDLEPKSRGRYFFGALKGLKKRQSWLRELARRRRARKRKLTKRRQQHGRAVHPKTPQ